MCIWWVGIATYLREERVQHPREGRVAEGQAGTFAVVGQLLVRLQLLLSSVCMVGVGGWGACHIEDSGRLRGAQASGLGNSNKGHGKKLWSQAQCPALLALPRGQDLQ